MAERRQAARRTPIEVGLEDGRVFVAKPLPWMMANDLGNAVLQEQAAGANESVRLYVEDNIPQLAVQLQLKIKDWQPILDIAYPENTHEEWSKPQAPDRDECAVLVIAALEVNNLEHLVPLVDPNFPPPTTLGGESTSESGMMPETDGLKMTSTPDYSELASVEVKP